MQVELFWTHVPINDNWNSAFVRSLKPIFNISGLFIDSRYNHFHHKHIPVQWQKETQVTFIHSCRFSCTEQFNQFWQVGKEFNVTKFP